NEFRAHQWTVPARVYARALELYPGKEMPAEALVAELQRLGYARRKHPDVAGTYSVDGNRVAFITRPFRFWDGEQPSLPVVAVFAGSTLRELQGNGGDTLRLVRLDPPLIGSLFPKTGEDRILVRLEEVPPVLTGL